MSVPSLAYIKQAKPLSLLVLNPKKLINLIKDGGKSETPNWNSPYPNDTAPMSRIITSFSIDFSFLYENLNE